MANEYKIDLHTHSVNSPDGGITREQYASILEKKVLDAIAITDHNDISFAQKMLFEFGPQIIVGEEIKTTEGEIIGLYLNKVVPPNLSAQETAKIIHGQGGVVYVPHPFETLRSGLKEEVLQAMIWDIDIIEVFNARAKWRGKADLAESFAETNNISMSAASDAHCLMGIGSAFATISDIPGDKALAALLKTGYLEEEYSPVLSYLCPAINKLKNSFKKYV